MQTTANSGHQHFSGSNSDTIIFPRPAHNLMLTTSGTVGLSTDGGANFMTITPGTYEFVHINVKRIDFNGTGTWSGIGLTS